MPSKPSAVVPPADYVEGLVTDWRAERPDLDVKPLEVVYRVFRLAAKLRAEVERGFSGTGVSSADFAVLANLRRAGAPYRLSQRQLMDRLNLTSGTVSVRIDRLADSGLVCRQPDPQDRRGVLVSLTEAGEELFDALAPRHLANEARLVAALAPAEQAELARLLQIVLVEFEPTQDRLDRILGLRLAPVHLSLERRAAVGLVPAAGLLVESVHPGGEAAAAGLQAGDLLVAVGDRPLHSFSSLVSALAGRRQILLRYRRREEEATVTLRFDCAGPSKPKATLGRAS